MYCVIHWNCLVCFQLHVEKKKELIFCRRLHFRVLSLVKNVCLPRENWKLQETGLRTIKNEKSLLVTIVCFFVSREVLKKLLQTAHFEKKMTIFFQFVACDPPKSFSVMAVLNYFVFSFTCMALSYLRKLLFCYFLQFKSNQKMARSWYHACINCKQFRMLNFIYLETF